MHASPIRLACLALVLSVLFLGLPRPASAQMAGAELAEHRYSGVGFAPSIPSIRTGVAAFHLFGSRNLGAYVAVRGTTDPPHRKANFEPDISPDVAGIAFQDLEVGRRSSYEALTVGLIRLVTPTSGLYAGVGYASGRHFIEFNDPLGRRGAGGFYWVERTEEEESGVNLGFGALIQLHQNLVFQGGIDTLPSGLTMTGYLALPW